MKIRYIFPIYFVTYRSVENISRDINLNRINKYFPPTNNSIFSISVKKSSDLARDYYCNFSRLKDGIV